MICEFCGFHSGIIPRFWPSMMWYCITRLGTLERIMFLQYNESLSPKGTVSHPRRLDFSRPIIFTYKHSAHYWHFSAQIIFTSRVSWCMTNCPHTLPAPNIRMNSKHVDIYLLLDTDVSTSTGAVWMHHTLISWYNYHIPTFHNTKIRKRCSWGTSPSTFYHTKSNIHVSQTCY